MRRKTAVKQIALSATLFSTGLEMWSNFLGTKDQLSDLLMLSQVLIPFIGIGLMAGAVCIFFCFLYSLDRGIAKRLAKELDTFVDDSTFGPHQKGGDAERYRRNSRRRKTFEKFKAWLVLPKEELDWRVSRLVTERASDHASTFRNLGYIRGRCRIRQELQKARYELEFRNPTER